MPEENREYVNSKQNARENPKCISGIGFDDFSVITELTTEEKRELLNLWKTRFNPFQ